MRLRALFGIAELVAVVWLCATWSEHMVNVPLRAVVMTIIPAFVGIGLGVILHQHSYQHRRQILTDLETLENHPYLEALREAFPPEPMYNLYGDMVTAEQLADMHNSLPARLQMRSLLIHPMVEAEMEDYEHAGCEQLATVPTPEPWVKPQEELIVGHMVSELYGKPLRDRYHLNFSEYTDYVDGIEEDIMFHLKSLHNISWPQLIIPENGEKPRYSANGSVGRIL